MQDLLTLKEVLLLKVFEAVKSYVLQIGYSHPQVKVYRLRQNLADLVPVQELLFNDFLPDHRRNNERVDLSVILIKLEFLLPDQNYFGPVIKQIAKILLQQIYLGLLFMPPYLIGLGILHLF